MRIYITDDGDTFARIAGKFQISAAELHDHNRHIAGLHERISSNQVIRIPVPPISEVPGVFPCPPGAEPDYLDGWIPVTSLESMEKTDYDVIIVGTGAGGGAALWRLCREWGANGKRIGVVETGDLLLPTHALNLPTINSERYRRLLLNPRWWKEVGPKEFAFRQILVLGGKTIFWNAVTPRMHPADIASWPLSADEMTIYYNIAEEIMNVSFDYTKGSLMNEFLLDRLRKNGFPESSPQPVAADMQPTSHGQLHTNVWFSSIIFLAIALNLRPFDLAVRARAVQVILDKGSAAGVKVMTADKKSYELKAKTIVLSAGTFESPRILLNSGIPGPAIGHYLMHHLRMNGTGLASRGDFPEVLGSVGLLIPRTSERPYQIQIQGPGRSREFYTYHYQEKPLRDQWAIDLEASGPVEARYENRMTLDPGRRDEYGVPEVQIHMSYSEADVEIVRMMDRDLVQAASAMRTPLIERDNIAVCLAPRGLDIHDMGTCRMGDNPETSATDRFGQIHGVPGLFVADNSVIPTSGAANPTLTTVALAIRTADYIIARLK